MTERIQTTASKNQGGSITVVIMIFLALLTLLAVSVREISTTDLWISKNTWLESQNFYVAEGGAKREAQEIGQGHYPIRDIGQAGILATQDSGDLPAPAPHRVLETPYDFTLEYVGAFPPGKGFSATEFTRYDYELSVRKDGAHIHARYARIGPRN